MIVIQRRMLIRCPGDRVAYDVVVGPDGRVYPLIADGVCQKCGLEPKAHKAIWINLIGVSS